jgi:RHS repeat-associated protein
MMRVEVQPTSGLTQLSVSLNEAPVVTLADFAGGVTRVDRPVSVLAQNALDYQLGGERGTAITVSILTLQMPKPVALSPSILGITLGQPGGTLSATLSPVPTAPGVLNVTSLNPSVASVPASVAFAAGQSTVAMPVAGVVSGITTIHASANGGTASASVQVNAPPTISITGPIQGATFTAPASVPIVVSAADTDGSVRRVDVLANGSAITTLTAAPFSFTWTGVPAGNYILTAKIFDNNDAQTVSTPVSISVTAHTAALYFIHVDHLNTPRLVSDSVGTPVWQWDQTEPFGSNAPDEKPIGPGSFEFPMRLSRGYADKETGNVHTYFRDNSPSEGRFLQSDPIGLAGGLHTYVYAFDPLLEVDVFGLNRSTGGYKKRPPSGMADCGPADGILGYFIPNNPSGFPFQRCCDAHDKCYDRCNGPDKLSCDTDGCHCFADSCKPYAGYVQAACRRYAQEYCYQILNATTADEQFRKAREQCKFGSCKP